MLCVVSPRTKKAFRKDKVSFVKQLTDNIRAFNKPVRSDIMMLTRWPNKTRDTSFKDNEYYL